MSRVFNLAEELEKERKKELEKQLKLAKEQDLYGIKIVANGEQYEAYKGTLQDQINELQERIDSAICYLEEHQEIISMIGTNYYKLLDKLKGK